MGLTLIKQTTYNKIMEEALHINLIRKILKQPKSHGKEKLKYCLIYVVYQNKERSRRHDIHYQSW